MARHTPGQVQNPTPSGLTQTLVAASSIVGVVGLVVGVCWVGGVGGWCLWVCMAPVFLSLCVGASLDVRLCCVFDVGLVWLVVGALPPPPAKGNPLVPLLSPLLASLWLPATLGHAVAFGSQPSLPTRWVVEVFVILAAKPVSFVSCRSSSMCRPLVARDGDKEQP